MAERILLHGIGGEPGGALARRLGVGLQPLGRLRPQVGTFERVVAALSGPASVIAEVGAGLPAGAAHAEAVAVRLRRSGALLEWGEPRPTTDVAELLRLSEERGRSALDVLRADPSLLTELQLGSWFDVDWRGRVVRRAAMRAPDALARLAVRVAADVAFWRGAWTAATDAEWGRLTGSSYTALVYHRLAGERRPGQDRVDLAPGRFEAQLGFLRLLGFHHLRSQELLAFHDGRDAVLPSRSFLVTVDDGFADVFRPLLARGLDEPQLFVSTSEIGGTAHWLDGEQLLTWDELRSLRAAGVSVGSHARHHRRLTEHVSADLADELEGSRHDLLREVPDPLPIVAYPHGDNDAAVRTAAAESGYLAGFTTDKGRNGAGTNVFCLRRVSVHAADGRFAVLWKVLTGEALPVLWLRLRRSKGSS